MSFFKVLIAESELHLDPDYLSNYNSNSSCPSGYRLAILDDPKDWEKATNLALSKVGHEKSVWIRFGLGWRGIGNEQWTILTPKPLNSCKFPPKDLKSFCVPIYHFRLSPRHDNPKLPSICEKITSP